MLIWGATPPYTLHLVYLFGLQNGNFWKIFGVLLLFYIKCNNFAVVNHTLCRKTAPPFCFLYRRIAKHRCRLTPQKVTATSYRLAGLPLRQHLYHKEEKRKSFLLFPRLWEEYSFGKLLNFTREETPFFRWKGQIAASLAICPRAPLFPKKTTRDLAGLWTLGILDWSWVFGGWWLAWLG